MAFALSRLVGPDHAGDTPIGVFRDVAKPSYDRLVHEQVDTRDREAGGPGGMDDSPR